MSKWMKNFISADSDGEVGACPICGSNETGYVIVQNPAFIEVWCNSCLVFDNMSYRGKPKPDRNVMSGDEYTGWKDTVAHHKPRGTSSNRSFVISLPGEIYTSMKEEADKAGVSLADMVGNMCVESAGVSEVEAMRVCRENCEKIRGFIESTKGEGVNLCSQENLY